MEPRHAKIKILRDFKKPNCGDFTKDESYIGKIHAIGYTGGFDRLPNDTMEGALEPSIIVEITSNCDKLGYLVEMKLHWECSISY